MPRTFPDDTGLTIGVLRELLPREVCDEETLQRFWERVQAEQVRHVGLLRDVPKRMLVRVLGLPQDAADWLCHVVRSRALPSNPWSLDPEDQHELALWLYPFLHPHKRLGNVNLLDVVNRDDYAPEELGRLASLLKPVAAAPEPSRQSPK
eukprot:m51a1_g7048 hypothetical protein (150) ;mRNA; r:131648-132209